MILYCAADLLWATRIKATADALGIACRPVRSLEMLAARRSDSEVRALIVDLEAEVAVSLIRALRADDSRLLPVIAFGPHVAVERFEEARNAGATKVLARGAFDRQLPEILMQLSGKAPS